MPLITVDLNKPVESIPRAALKLLLKITVPFLDHQSVYTVEKKGIFKSAEELAQVHFSHNLLKAGEGEWHIIENDPKGKGAFGVVQASKLKICVKKNGKNYVAKFVKGNDIVKAQTKPATLSDKAFYEQIESEAKRLLTHNVKVKSLVQLNNKIYIVMEDCGVSLDKLLPFNPPHDFSFESRLELAIQIAREMLLLQQTGVIHRDLKPANICRRKLPRGGHQLLFIDFGLANEVGSVNNYNASGTYIYMAPEVFAGKGSTYASDIYALAGIFGLIFGARDILKNKMDARFLKMTDVVNAGYCYDGLFEGYNLSGADRPLLDEIRHFFKLLESHNPLKRPTINHINKFLILIQSRIIVYADFLTQWNKMEELFNEFENFHQHLKILKAKPNLQLFGQNRFQAPVSLNAFASKLLKSKESIYKALCGLPAVKSHKSLIDDLIKNNRTADFAVKDNPFPDVTRVIQLLEQENAKFRKTLSGVDNCFKAFSKGNKFANTNSTGMIKIAGILQSAVSPLEKLEQLQRIGAAKTEPDWFNYYSHSSIFGKGRHKNVDALYKKLALLNPYHSVNKADYLAETQLKEVEEFINNTSTFTH